jgi:hypothetical protein
VQKLDELIGLLKSGESELAKIQVFHIAIDPQQGAADDVYDDTRLHRAAAAGRVITYGRSTN